MSRSWLYRQPDLRADINRLRRDATAQAVPVPSPERGSTESLRQRLEAARDEITNCDHYRARVLLYAGIPDWNLLDTLTAR